MSADIKEYLADQGKLLTSGARRKDYGRPVENFRRIALLWSAYFKLRFMDEPADNIDLMPHDVAAMMRLVKEARLIETPDHLDSFIDLVGYALTGAEVAGVKVPHLPDTKDGPYYDINYRPTKEPPLGALLPLPPDVPVTAKAIDDYMSRYNESRARDDRPFGPPKAKKESPLI